MWQLRRQGLFSLKTQCTARCLWACGSTEMKCINKVSLNCEASCLWRHQESNWDARLVFYAQSFALSIIKPRFLARLLCLWCHQESNRGHKDFQSFALPTELWHQFLFASANLRVILILAKRRAVFLRFLGKRGWLAAELAAESSAVAGFPAA